MIKRILYITLLGLFLQPQVISALNEPETTENKAYTIPLVNIPISFEKKDEECSNLDILSIAFLHAFLAYLQKNDNSMTLQTMVGQQALFWATRHVLGLLSTIGHELGHAIAGKQQGLHSSITIMHSPRSWLTGIYEGCTRYAIKKDTSYIDLEEESKAITNKESYLEWSSKIQKKCSQVIVKSLAGPIAGIATTGILMYALSYIQPTLWSQNIRNVNFGTRIAMISMLQNIYSLFPSEGFDGARIWDAWVMSQMIEERIQQVRELPDGSSVTLPFYYKQL